MKQQRKYNDLDLRTNDWKVEGKKKGGKNSTQTKKKSVFPENVFPQCFTKHI